MLGWARETWSFSVAASKDFILLWKFDGIFVYPVFHVPCGGHACELMETSPGMKKGNVWWQTPQAPKNEDLTKWEKQRGGMEKQSAGIRNRMLKAKIYIIGSCWSLPLWPHALGWWSLRNHGEWHVSRRLERIKAWFSKLGSYWTTVPTFPNLNCLLTHMHPH